MKSSSPYPFHYLLVITLSFFLFFGNFVKAQSVSYNVNSVPIVGSNNSAFGYNALTSNSTGNQNSAFGYNVLTLNTTGNQNSAFGYYSLSSNTSGRNNTAVGTQSLRLNTTGGFNVGVGYNSLYWNSSGFYNCAIGVGACGANTSGWSNTSVGMNSLFQNTTGGGNTSVGMVSLYNNITGSNNTALGYTADVLSGSLTNATAIGYGAIVNASNTMQLGNSSLTHIYAGTGSNATIVTGGLQVTGGSPGIGKVLTSDASGIATWQTPAAGTGTGWLITGNAGTVDGTNFIGTTDFVPLNFRANNIPAGKLDPINNNTFLGVYAAQNTVGSDNTAIGYQALVNNASGQQNIAVGKSSLHNNGGSANVAVGNHSLITNFSGTYLTAIGHGTDVTNTGLTNSSALGFHALINTSNKIRLGDVNVTVVEGPVAYTISDGRFKENIREEDVKGLDFINRLRPVVYNFNAKDFQQFLTQQMADSLRSAYMNKDFTAASAIRQSGFIAQEVELAAMESGYDFNGLHKPESELDNYSLAYGQFVVPLVKSVQELSQQNQALVQMVNEQQRVNEQLSRELAELKSLVLGRTENLSTTENIKALELKATAAEAKLFQNTPNPFSKSTTIRYTIPENAGSAKIRVTNMDGALLFEADLISNNGRPVEIPANKLSAGTYIYSLFVDGVLADSKKMVVTR